MPWQEHVIAIATEFDPDTGRPCYRNVWITVPRQSGKTTLVLILILLRLLWYAGAQRISYTAQTGQDAREKLLEDWKPVLKQSAEFWGDTESEKPTGDGLVAKVREQSGSEGITFVDDSILRVIASGKSAGHGKTLHQGFIDEAFHDRDLRREQAMIPAQNTVKDAQLIGLSTMGDADSVLLNARVKQGREAVKRNSGRGMAYFEWSAPPGTPLDDEAAWRRCMPALGHTIDIDVVRDALESFTVGVDADLGPDEFRRAYLNVPTSGRRTVFPDGAWEMVARMDVAPAGELTLALEATPERKSASIAVADNDHALELIEHRTGTGWVLDRTQQLAEDLNAPVVIDKGGPANTFIAPLKKRGVTVIEAGTRELTMACGSFYDGVIDRTIEVRSHPDAQEAIAKARQRTVGESWAWARKVGDHDATPLVAMSLALWGVSNRPDPDDDGVGAFAAVL